VKQKTRVSPTSFTPAPSLRLARKCACGSTPQADGRCPDCEAKRRQDEARVQRSALGPAPASAAPPAVDRVLATSGAPLPATTRHTFESRLGHDFSGVRVHTDSAAGESAKAVNALAYAVGDHVVFAPGQYRPETPAGAQLLAHELAHTVQQRGLQRYSAGVAIASGPEEVRLEHEADHFARVISGNADIAPVRPASAPVLSKAPHNWTPITPGSPLLSDATDQEILGTSIAFKMLRPFQVPNEKGPAGARYVTQAQTQGVGLEAKIGFAGNQADPQPFAALWQSRALTADLRDSWLQKVGWTSANAGANWHQAGGEDPGTTGFPRVNPRAGGRSCDMDHIVELQLGGGTNQRENIAPLNSVENQASGRAIWTQLSRLALSLYSNLPTKPTEITLHFDSAVQAAPPPVPSGCSAPGTARDCTAVEYCAVSRRSPALTQPGAVTAGLENYAVTVGTNDVIFRTAPGPGTTDLLTTGPENLNSAEAVSGLILKSLTRTASGNDTMIGNVESAGMVKRTHPTRVPIAIAGHNADIPFTLVRQGQQRILRLSNPPRNLAFTYPFLSDGQITQLSFSAEAGLTATGWLQPSIPMLQRVNIHLGQGELRAEISIDPARFSRLIPGLRVTRTDVAISLAPQLSVTGSLDFTIGTSLRGTLSANLDTSGLVISGDVTATIPGVDGAHGNITYRNHEWTGAITANTSQIPGVQSATVTVGFNNSGVYATGGLVFQLPNGTIINLNIRRDPRGRWIYTGETTIELPRLHPLNLKMQYDGEHVTGTAHTGVTLRGFTGDVTATYRDGRFSGRGALTFSLGRATGTATINLGSDGSFSGQGSLTYPLTPSLTATVGISISEAGLVRASGELTFAQAITLFEGIHRDITLFTLPTLEIPIIAIPVGTRSVGLVATIDANLRAGFGVGPGQLRNTRALARLNPLADNPDLEVELGTQLVIPAYAGISATIRGGIGVSVGIGSLTGGLDVTGSANLRGGLDSQFTIHYARGVFVAEANAVIEAGLVLGLDLTADVTARVGAFGLEYAKRWEWPLANYQYNTGLNFRIAAPIRYASNEPFHAPSVDDITFTPPRIDVGALIPRMFNSAQPRESAA
jgi:Domain of unknown function (DUF4157)